MWCQCNNYSKKHKLNWYKEKSNKVTTTKNDITYGKTIKGTNCRINWKMQLYFFLSSQPYGDLAVGNDLFYTPGGSPN